MIADRHVPDRERVIEIISGDFADVSVRKRRLKGLGGGRAWAYMLDNIFPHLRGAYAQVYCVMHVGRSLPVPPDEVPELELPDMSGCVNAESLTLMRQPASEIVVDRYPLLAVRSNLLLPLLNVGVDVPLSAHWTLGADYYYPWFWPKKSNKQCFEVTYFSGEARYWLNAASGSVPMRNYMTGHSVAAYGAWGYYDIERDYKGHQGNAWSVGVDYMYALPIAKGRLRLELQIAIGYVRSQNAIPYTVYEEGGRLIRERGVLKNFSYAGPTKLSVTLALPINRSVKRLAPELP